MKNIMKNIVSWNSKKISHMRKQWIPGPFLFSPPSQKRKVTGYEARGCESEGVAPRDYIQPCRVHSDNQLAN